MITKSLCFALDLKDEPRLIQQYIEHHKKVWPDFIESIKDSDIVAMEIYNVFNKLFMVIEVNPDFSLKAKATRTIKKYRNGKS